MGTFNWLHSDWFILLQSVGIVGGLCFDAIAHVMNARAQQAANLLEITKQHHELWSEFDARPALWHILESQADLTTKGVTLEEERFLKWLILHLATAYRTKQLRMVAAPEKLAADISSFFALPISLAVWEKSKLFHDEDFVRFIERTRRAGVASRRDR